MSFIHVKNFRINAERGQGLDAANPEHQLLPHPHFEIATVKLGGDEPILGIVFGNVGIEKIKSDATDVQLPNFREDFAAEQSDRDEQIAIATAHLADRQMVEVLV